MGLWWFLNADSGPFLFFVLACVKRDSAINKIPPGVGHFCRRTCVFKAAPTLRHGIDSPRSNLAPPLFAELAARARARRFAVSVGCSAAATARRGPGTLRNYPISCEYACMSVCVCVYSTRAGNPEGRVNKFTRPGVPLACIKFGEWVEGDDVVHSCHIWGLRNVSLTPRDLYREYFTNRCEGSRSGVPQG